MLPRYKKLTYIVTWGGGDVSSGQVCFKAPSHKKAVAHANECDKTPGSAKKHRIFLCREVNRR